MRTVRGLESYRPEAVASAVALGAFDGIHLGHRAILGTAVAQARQGRLHAVACTFDRHPMEALPPGRAPLPLTNLGQTLQPVRATPDRTTLGLPLTRTRAALRA